MPHQPLAAPRASELMDYHVRTVTPEMALAEVVAFMLKHELAVAPVVEAAKEGPSRLVGILSEQDCLEHLANEIFYGSPYQRQTVHTMMTRHPVCVGPDTDGFGVASLFVSHGFKQLPVVDEQHRLLGMIRRGDVLKALERYYTRAAEEYGLEHFPPDLREVANMRFVVRNE